MDNYKMGEIIKDMFLTVDCKHYGLILDRAEYDEYDGTVGIIVRDKGKLKRFVIEVKEI